MMKLLPRSMIAMLALAGVCAPSLAIAGQDIVERSRAKYAALQSYSDTGTIDTQYSSIREQHKFTTRFRKPRHFYFDWNEDPKAGADRVVVWSDDTTFHSWWSTTGVEGTYPKGQGANAFVNTSGQTRGSVLNIAPWLFPSAGLQGVLTAFTEGKADGEEVIAGRRCFRIKGVQRMKYATGYELAPRRTTLWIDAETLLVRRIFEDTPRGSPAGTIARTTTTFEPQANPPLKDAQFEFEVPNAEDEDE